MDIYTLVLLVLVYAAGLLLFWYGARLWYRPADIVGGASTRTSNEGQGEHSRANEHAAGSLDWWAHWSDVG